MLIKFIHAKFYASAIAIYNASKMNTHEFNKLLGFEAGAHSPFHTPTGSATWYVIQFRARTAILAAESRTQRMWACPINVRSRCHQQISSRIKCFLSRAFCHILSFILEHTIVWVARKLQHELRMHIPIVVCCAGKVAAPVAVTARRRWPGVPWEIFCGYKPIWFYFIFCLSHCSEVCNIMLHGTTL